MWSDQHRQKPSLGLASNSQMLEMCYMIIAAAFSSMQTRRQGCTCKKFIWDMIPGSTCRGAGKWHRERKEAIDMLLIVKGWQLCLSSTKTSGRGWRAHLRAVQPEGWGSWGTYPPALVSHCLRAAPRGINFLPSLELTQVENPSTCIKKHLVWMMRAVIKV